MMNVDLYIKNYIIAISEDFTKLEINIGICNSIVSKCLHVLVLTCIQPLTINENVHFDSFCSYNNSHIILAIDNFWS